jgi:hypothetical protein
MHQIRAEDLRITLISAELQRSAHFASWDEDVELSLGRGQPNGEASKAQITLGKY